MCTRVTEPNRCWTSCPSADTDWRIRTERSWGSCVGLAESIIRTMRFGEERAPLFSKFMSPSSSDLKSRLLLEEFRYAFRVLRKMPGLTLTVLLSLGIGIGVLTATFTIGYITILTPLPYPDPG